LNRKILAETPAATVAADSPPKAGLRGLLRVRACLETIGALEPSPSLRLFAPGSARIAVPAVPASAGSPSGAADAPETDAAGIPTLRLSGSPYEMGLQHGRSLGPAIRRTLRRYADQAGLSDGTANGETATPAESLFAPDELEEIRGLAEGAGVARASILAFNARLRARRPEPAVASDENEPDRRLQVRLRPGGPPATVRALPGEVPASRPHTAGREGQEPAAPVSAVPEPRRALTELAFARDLAAGVARSPGGTADRFCHRFVIRMVEAPVPKGTPDYPRFAGPALLVGENRLAAVLAGQIRARGGSVEVLPASDDVEAALVALEGLWARSP
jgi:hypothetical protein